MSRQKIINKIINLKHLFTKQEWETVNSSGGFTEKNLNNLSYRELAQLYRALMERKERKPVSLNDKQTMEDYNSGIKQSIIAKKYQITKSQCIFIIKRAINNMASFSDFLKKKNNIH